MPAPLFPGVSDDDILAALRASGANLAPPPDQLAAEVAAAPPPQPSPFFPASQIAAPPPAAVETQMPPMDVGVPDQGAIPEPLGMPNLPRLNPMDVAGAEQQQQDVLSGAAAAHTRSLEGTMVAQNNQLGRQAGVESDYANRQAGLDADFQVAREAAHQRAAAETAGWLRQMDTLANTEPNHQRFWQNQDRFGKGLWLLGMAFSSAALIGTPSAGQRRNPVLEMLKQEIDSDVQDQKDSLAKRGAALKTKGDLMLRGQDQSMADLRDDHSMAYQRLESLKRGALLKAQQLPDGDVRKMAMLQGADWLGQQQFSIADDKVKTATTLHEGAASRANSMAQAKLHAATQLALTDIEAQSKREALGAQAAKGGEDLRQMSPSTGFVRADGSPLTYHKDQQDDVRKAQKRWTDTANVMKVLRHDIEQQSFLDKIANMDPKVLSSQQFAIGPVAELLNGGGRMTEDDVARGAMAMLGMDPASFISRFKTNKADVLALLDRHIANMPAQAAQDVAGATGVDVRDVKFVPPDIMKTEAPGAGSRADQLRLAGAGSPISHPKSIDDYLAKRKEGEATGSSVLPDLPGPLSTTVKDFTERAKTMPDFKVDRARDAALKAINAYRGAKGVTEADIKDATTRVAAESAEQHVAGSERLKAAVYRALHDYGGGDKIGPDLAVRAYHKAGMGTPDTEEIEYVLRAVREQRGEYAPSAGRALLDEAYGER